MAGPLTAFALIVTLVAGVTGALLIPNGVLVAFVPFVQALHVVAGLVALIPTAIVLVHHLRLRGYQHVGGVTALILMVAFVSGLAQAGLAAAGATPPSWLLPVHLLASGISMVLTVWHIGLIARAVGRFRRVRRVFLPGLLGSLAAIGAAVAAASFSRSTGSLPPNYSLPYGESPFAPSSAALADTTGTVHAATFAGSDRCASCHAEIYAQWSESMHRYSATDPHVATGIRWFQRDNGAESGRLCAGCHSPVALLSGGVDPATSPPDVGTRPHDDGVACLICHSTVHVDQTPLGNGSYRLALPDVPALPAGPLFDAAVRLDVARHKSAMRSPVLADPLLCASCHTQFTPEAVGGRGPSETHGQFPEWRSGPLAEGPNKKTCNDCHMPLIPSTDPAARDGKIHSHRFAGANVAHAEASGHVVQAAESLAMLRSGLRFTLAPAPVQDRPGHLVVLASVENHAVGHRFPSGTTDISETWIELTAGPAAAPIFLSGALDEKHYLDEKAHVYKIIYVDGGNVPVDLHNLAQVRKTTLDRFVAPGTTDVARYEIPLAGHTGPLPIVARLRMRKANQRWNDWLSNFDGSTVPVTDIFEARLSADPLALGVPAGSLPSERPLAARAGPSNAPAVAGMSYIPSGPVRIGSDEGDADERPVHEVDVPGFYLDKTPVTNAEFARFVVAAHRSGPVHHLDWAAAYNWKGQAFPEGTGARPAVLIRWEDARDYCQWVGKRMPREVEWEKAARGPDGRRYPWGDTWDDGLCPAIDGMEVPSKTGLCPNRASPYGVQDMIGGVFEWVADIYQAYDRTHLHPNANEWINSFGDPSYVLRGAPAGHVGPATTASARSGHADNMRAKIGFRCAKDRSP